MASYGVWENVTLCKTPTMDGVYGMLFFTIDSVLEKLSFIIINQTE